MKDFFISFTGADKAWADWIAYTLHEAGYDFHYQGWHFGPGANFVAEMQTGTTQTERTIAVLSPKYFDSAACTAEWTAAFNRDKDGTKRLLLPIRIADFDPPGMWGPRVYVDLHGVDEATAKQRLLDALVWEPGPPAARPVFPGAKPVAPTAAPPFPGAASSVIPKRPRIWNVPHRRNPNFTGREELLKSLHASLTSGDYAALTQAMHGLGGVGKTQTAIEYAYRYESEYEAVLWIPAEEPSALTAHFTVLAEEIGLAMDPADQPGAVAGVKRWLREHGRWLLIFDNAEAASDIQPLLPQAGTGHVLVTSRNPEWRRIATPLAVRQFTSEEAIAFLLTRAGRDAADKSARTAAATLAEELGGLALALEQAAAYIETHELSLAEYLRLFQEHRELVLSHDPSPDYPHTIETVWSIALEAVRTMSPAAAELLILLAFFSPDDIPLDLIRTGADAFPEALAEAAKNELELRTAIRVLRRYSLIEVSENSIAIHRVVQSITRNSLSDAAQKARASAAIKALATALPATPSDVLTWSMFSRLSSQVNAVAQHCEMLGVELEVTAFCLNQIGRYLHERADYRTAKQHFERAIQIYERVYGTDRIETAEALNNLGGVRKSLGELPAARADLERALRICGEVLGPDHPSNATFINNLGAVLEDLGEFAEARSNYERALQIDEQAFGANHPQVANRLNNLGSVLRATGDLDGAQASFERALQIYEMADGAMHPSVALVLSNLGVVLLAMGDYEGAHASHERALQIDEAAFGPDHPRVAIRVNNLGSVLQAKGDLAGAEASASRALEICRKYLGDEHPRTQLVRRNLEIAQRELHNQ